MFLSYNSRLSVLSSTFGRAEICHNTKTIKRQNIMMVTRVSMMQSVKNARVSIRVCCSECRVYRLHIARHCVCSASGYIIVIF